MEIDNTTQDKLKRLEQLEQKIKAKKTKERERLRRYIDKQLKNGKRQIACLVSGKVYETMNAIRSKSKLQGQTLSLADIIEKAVLTTYSNNSIDNVAITDGKKSIELKSNIQATENVELDTTRNKTKDLFPKSTTKPSVSLQTNIEGKHQPLSESELQRLCERLKHPDRTIKDYNDVATILRNKGLKNADIHAILIKNGVLSISGKPITIENVRKWK